MKARMLATVVLLFLTVGICATGANSEDQTYGMKNGRFWNALDDSQRAAFLAGLEDGWSLRGHTESTVLGKVILALHPCGSSVTYGEEAEMITAAYKEPENRSLPIGWVMMADSAIQCGKTTSNAVFPALRKHLADISGKTVGGDALLPIDVISAASINKP